MNEQELKEFRKEVQLARKDLEAVKLLLALQLKTAGVSVISIGKAMGVTGARVSQLLAESKKKGK